MKTKNLISYTLIFLIIFCTTNYTKSQSNKNTETKDSVSEEQIIIMLKNFYKAYITLNSKIRPPKIQEFKSDSIKAIYCSKNLLTSLKRLTIDEIDYDPFINTQDCVEEILITLTITKDRKRDNLFVISYIRPWGEKERVSTELKIVKESDHYKIGCIFVNNLKIGC